MAPSSRDHIEDIALKPFLDRGDFNVTTDEQIRASDVSRPTAGLIRHPFVST
ncbi:MULTISPECIES: hypothetical protein [unclassified Brevibacterium]|uniref:hypothetical protein n=1 Tax=unclassified Brevibacterium TaxID=2614124 RepID=UPI001E3C2700|nr:MULTISPECIES: hypothetical protein [unclassified Brevibacterium]MDK8436380.1 hypothetical protein [Brevibacterium sp. H-BE7]